jgi:hypothetical protein
MAIIPVSLAQLQQAIICCVEFGLEQLLVATSVGLALQDGWVFDRSRGLSRNLMITTCVILLILSVASLVSVSHWYFPWLCSLLLGWLGCKLLVFMVALQIHRSLHCCIAEYTMILRTIKERQIFFRSGLLAPLSQKLPPVSRWEMSLTELTAPELRLHLQQLMHATMSLLSLAPTLHSSRDTPPLATTVSALSSQQLSLELRRLQLCWAAQSAPLSLSVMALPKVWYDLFMLRKRAVEMTRWNWKGTNLSQRQETESKIETERAVSPISDSDPCQEAMQLLLAISTALRYVQEQNETKGTVESYRMQDAMQAVKSLQAWFEEEKYVRKKTWHDDEHATMQNRVEDDRDNDRDHSPRSREGLSAQSEVMEYVDSQGSEDANEKGHELRRRPIAMYEWDRGTEAEHSGGLEEDAGLAPSRRPLLSREERIRQRRLEEAVQKQRELEQNHRYVLISELQTVLGSLPDRSMR